jgi:dTDP-4-amino-4,6-dideoxygalactose transaminase
MAQDFSMRLPLVDGWNLRRREIVEEYRRSAVGSAMSFPGIDGADCVAHLAVALHPNRNELRSILEELNVETGVHYPVLDNEQPAWRQKCAPSPLQVSKEASETILTLPCHPGLSNEEVRQVCDALHLALQRF